MRLGRFVLWLLKHQIAVVLRRTSPSLPCRDCGRWHERIRREPRHTWVSAGRCARCATAAREPRQYLALRCEICRTTRVLSEPQHEPDVAARERFLAVCPACAAHVGARPRPLGIMDGGRN
jgi:hypothetical protein